MITVRSAVRNCRRCEFIAKRFTEQSSCCRGTSTRRAPTNFRGLARSQTSVCLSRITFVDRTHVTKSLDLQSQWNGLRRTYVSAWAPEANWRNEVLNEYNWFLLRSRKRILAMHDAFTASDLRKFWRRSKDDSEGNGHGRLNGTDCRKLYERSSTSRCFRFAFWNILIIRSNWTVRLIVAVNARRKYKCVSRGVCVKKSTSLSLRTISLLERSKTRRFGSPFKALEFRLTI